MTRVLLAGLPRSGTSWLGDIFAAAPGVRYVFEPDTWDHDPTAILGLRWLGPEPHLQPGQRAANYRLLWRFAFGGGWTSGGVTNAATVVRLMSAAKMPMSRRISLSRRVARLAARSRTPGPHTVVKSVMACQTLEWIVHEFTPEVVVVWRHPMNLVPSWRDRGWSANVILGDPKFLEFLRTTRWGPEDFPVGGAKALRERFGETPLWPPPDDGLARTGWVLCAESVVLLETAAAHPEWTVIGHERFCLDPVPGLRAMFARFGIEWVDEVDRLLTLSDRPGSGYEKSRRRVEEPLRWKERLTPAEQEELLAMVRAFEAESDVAASAWRASPAMDLDKTR